MISDRFWSKTKSSTDGCLLWTAGTDNKGYGAFWADGKIQRAHRYLFEETYGPIPEGMLMDHVCRNHRCVKLEHLRLVSSWQNTMFGNGPAAINSRKTRCQEGHPFSEDNTIVFWNGGGWHRDCRICKVKKHKFYRDRKRLNEKNCVAS